MKEQLISIILPTYNRSELIKRCVNSVLNQTYSNWELIISDDGSKDETPIVARECEKLDSRIKAKINVVNHGTPSNRNIGLSLVRGNLVFFIEDDLVLFPNCVETLVNTYTSLVSSGIKVGAVVPRLIEYNPISYINEDLHKKEANEKKLPFVFNKWTGEVYNNYTEDFNEVQETVTGHACCLYNRSALQEVGGYEEKAYKGTYGREETDLNFRLSKAGYKFFFQPEAVSEHKKIKTGGSRQSNQAKFYYYGIRNHFIFLVRIFGARAIYMIPCYLINTQVRLLKKVSQKIFSILH
jgi:glycosyltransferase involved in cell wall biosynthesis